MQLIAYFLLLGPGRSDQRSSLAGWLVTHHLCGGMWYINGVRLQIQTNGSTTYTYILRTHTICLCICIYLIRCYTSYCYLYHRPIFVFICLLWLWTFRRHSSSSSSRSSSRLRFWLLFEHVEFAQNEGRVEVPNVREYITLQQNKYYFAKQ